MIILEHKIKERNNMSYNFDKNNLFSVIFETHLSSIVKDEIPAGQPATHTYSLEQAQTRYKQILGNDAAQMPLFFNQKSEFIFNNYSAGGYYENPDLKELTYPLVRKFNSENFKRSYGGESISITSINRLTVPLNYRIGKKGLNFGEVKEAARNNNKKKLNDLLAKGASEDGRYRSNKELFPRILKIMSFILGRERGSDPNVNGSSEELMHREYGIICWALVNAAIKGRFKCGYNILKLSQDHAYINPLINGKYHISDSIDVIDNAETTIMDAIYKERVKDLNLQLFVMAFWDGYINEELPNVTNWDHVSSKGASFVFRGFHLPSSLKNQPDPDVGQKINIKIDNKEGKTFAEQTIEEGQKFNITSTSNGDTFTLDGNVLFTIN